MVSTYMKNETFVTIHGCSNNRTLRCEEGLYGTFVDVSRSKAV